MFSLATLAALLASGAAAQDVYTARLMQDSRCLAPDSPTFNSPVNFQDCNKNPYQWWEVRGSSIHLGNTGFCLSAGRSESPASVLAHAPTLGLASSLADHRPPPPLQRLVRAPARCQVLPHRVPARWHRDGLRVVDVQGRTHPECPEQRHVYCRGRKSHGAELQRRLRPGVDPLVAASVFRV